MTLGSDSSLSRSGQPGPGPLADRRRPKGGPDPDYMRTEWHPPPVRSRTGPGLLPAFARWFVDQIRRALRHV